MVNHDDRDGTAPDPVVWSAGSLPRRRRLVQAVRDPGISARPPGIWDSEWVNVPVSAICAADIAHWPYTTGFLVKWVALLGTLHWPADGVDLGVGDISYVELLTLFELWAGERLTLEKAHPRYRRPGRPNSVSAVPFGPGIDFWRSCRFIGAMMRSLCLLPGGLLGGLCLAPLVLIIAGFVILVGRSVAMDSLLGLGKVPLSFSWMSFWDSFASLLGLGVHYLLVLFTFGIVLLVLPVSGQVTRLFPAGPWVVQEAADDGACREVHWVSGFGPGRKRIRLNRQPPCKPRWFNGSISSTCVEEVASCGAFRCFSS